MRLARFLMPVSLLFAFVAAAQDNATIKPRIEKQAMPDDSSVIMAPPPPAPAPLPSSKIFSYVEQMPVAGYDLEKYLQEHLRYPKEDSLNGIEGRVIVKFLVDENGSTSDWKVVRGLTEACDAEAVRVLGNMPRWKPARQNGQAVKVYYTFPVVFRINR